jgi:glycine cleavage system transcriptional repressor
VALRHFAISAIGQDRPGIVAAVTGALHRQGLNIEDSQMAILRGHFSMTLVVAAGDDVDEAALRSALDAAAAEAGLEAHALSEVTDAAGNAASPTHIVTVYGADHPGIVAAVSAALADRAVNITDLNTRLLGPDDLYVMMLEVELPETLEAAALEGLLEAADGAQGLEISVRELEQDEL